MQPRSESPPDADDTSTDGWYAAEIVNMRLTMPEKAVTKTLAPNGWVEVLVHWQTSGGHSECLQWQSLQHMCELGYDALQHIHIAQCVMDAHCKLASPRRVDVVACGRPIECAW